MRRRAHIRAVEAGGGGGGESLDGKRTNTGEDVGSGCYIEIGDKTKMAEDGGGSRMEEGN